MTKNRSLTTDFLYPPGGAICCKCLIEHPKLYHFFTTFIFWLVKVRVGRAPGRMVQRDRPYPQKPRRQGGGWPPHLNPKGARKGERLAGTLAPPEICPPENQREPKRTKENQREPFFKNQVGEPGGTPACAPAGCPWDKPKADNLSALRAKTQTNTTDNRPGDSRHRI
jgi:hypothetical protein